MRARTTGGEGSSCDPATGLYEKEDAPPTITRKTLWSGRLGPSNATRIPLTLPENIISFSVIAEPVGSNHSPAIAGLRGPGGTTLFDSSDPFNSKLDLYPHANTDKKGTYAFQVPNAPQLQAARRDIRAVHGRHPAHAGRGVGVAEDRRAVQSAKQAAGNPVVPAPAASEHPASPVRRPTPKCPPRAWPWRSTTYAPTPRSSSGPRWATMAHEGRHAAMCGQP